MTDVDWMGVGPGLLLPPEETFDIVTQSTAIHVPLEPVWQTGVNQSWMNNTWLNQSLVNNTQANRSRYLTQTNIAAKCYNEPMQKHDAFYLVFTTLLTGIVCVIGLVGNILALYVLFKDQKKNLITVLLTGLCMVDWFLLLYLLLAVVVKDACLYRCDCDCVGSLVPVLPYLWPWSAFAQMVMIWTIVMASFSRYVAVCHPFRFRDFSTAKIGKRMLGVIIILCFLFQLPRIIVTYLSQGSARAVSDDAPLVVQPVSEGHCYISSTPTRLVLNGYKDTLAANLSGDPTNNDPTLPLDRNVWYRDVYLVGLTWVFMYIVPIITLLYMNIRLIIELQRAMNTRMMMSNQKSDIQDHSMTINIIAIISVFLMCQTPDFITVIITHYPSLAVSMATKRYIIAISIFLQAINSAIDFLIYFTFYARFRSEAIRLLCPCATDMTWTSRHPRTPSRTESTLLSKSSEASKRLSQSQGQSHTANSDPEELHANSKLLQNGDVCPEGLTAV